MSAKIALTYIVKDNSEYNLFEKSLESFMPYFDGLYVAVTGPSGEHDKIHRLVKNTKVSLYQLHLQHILKFIHKKKMELISSQTLQKQDKFHGI